jgi:hypothetical protein
MTFPAKDKSKNPKEIVPTYIEGSIRDCGNKCLSFLVSRVGIFPSWIILGIWGSTTLIYERWVLSLVGILLYFSLNFNIKPIRIIP